MRFGLLALALAGALMSGCAAGGAGGTPDVPASASAAPSTTAPSTAPAAPDAAACQRHAPAAAGIRKVIGAIEAGPVLPAGVALFLLAPRQAYAVPGVQDPELAATVAEVVAAIDDLDAQGKALLPPGGNATQDAVRLDPTRIRAALENLDRLCGSGS